MLKKVIPVALCSSAFIIAGAITGCGSSDSDDDRNVAGVWRGQIVETRNSCNGLRVVTSGSIEHTVNQNEDAVALQNAQGRQFQGELIGDDGFVADGSFTETFNDGSLCDANKLIEYDGIDSDSDTTADVDVTTVFTCPDGFTCEVFSEGPVNRVTGATPANPTPTPDPRGGDCSTLLERTYTGDSGCGISEVNVSHSGGDTVVIDPLGANGASSFSVSDADAGTASSNSSDLQIMGAGNYSCSISCPSEITFTLSCFQEGGETCEERF